MEHDFLNRLIGRFEKFFGLFQTDGADVFRGCLASDFLYFPIELHFTEHHLAGYEIERERLIINLIMYDFGDVQHQYLILFVDKLAFVLLQCSINRFTVFQQRFILMQQTFNDGFEMSWVKGLVQIGIRTHFQSLDLTFNGILGR